MSTMTGLGALSMLIVVAFTLHAIRGGVRPIAAITEAWANVIIGFTLNFVANLFILPMLESHPHIGAWENFWMGWIYTAISVLRQYAIRRWCADSIRNFALRVDEFVKTK